MFQDLLNVEKLVHPVPNGGTNRDVPRKDLVQRSPTSLLNQSPSTGMVIVSLLS